MGMFDDLTPGAAAAAQPSGLFADLMPQAPRRNLGGDLLRQAGLTGRYLLEGVPQAADLLWSPAKLAIDATMGAVKGEPFRSPTMSELGGQAADALGLPAPQTAQERVVGDASRAVAGVIGSAGPARLIADKVAAPVVKKVAEEVARNVGTQAISGAAAGGAGGVTREQGGTPAEQAVAAFAAGLAAPAAAGAVRKAGEALMRTAGQRFDPARLDMVLKTELSRAGIDWDTLGANVRLQLRKDAERAVYSGQPIDAQALRRLAEFRSIGATPLLGDVTQDPRLLTLQRNLSKQLANMRSPLGAKDLPTLTNENAKRVLSTLDDVADSPHDAFATGQRIIGSVQSTDDALRGAENALYAQARDSAGRAVPLDREAFVRQAYENLARSNKGAFLPTEIGKLIEQIGAGRASNGGHQFDVPFNVDVIDNLKTTLATASRGTKDGNVRAAISEVYKALESTGVAPVKRDFGGGQVVTQQVAGAMRQADEIPSEAMRLFDQARAAARGRRNWQESAAFIEDALGGAEPDKFVQKHVINASVNELSKLKDQIASTPELLNATRKQLVDYILQRGRASSDVTSFTSAGMADGLKALGDRKLALFFSPDEIAQIRAAVNVGRYLQAQPIGSAVNNSNTAAMLTARLSDLLGRTTGVPVIGPMFTEPLQGVAMNLQARSLRDLSRGLAPAAAAPGASSAAIPLSLLLAAPAANGVENEHRR